ncbi:KdsC family phosphatase [Pectinatus cerevisiiphilus]|uniref:3-deoxy-D-manno-octulosonate 8-phosphate phosphatase (KDO 8-P phosphatase) n=1 Tax=Pectinatus cerevisiiphilus TaxID=86956 RepID=A0A4R3KC50_9FIRM|nr:HAD-IIIA family hydrolase [Pectinatus cerevisiiphilus]TCS80479.1 3-deoxy-D-manno-octulosonate 8-phosphate phosphatase (KDO 8-P phosphatase) [Pectinatus cerevisiiphilus]
MLLKEEAVAHAAKVRMIIFDVDGVLSDGKLYYGSDGEIFKAFFVRDGLGISLARQSGIKLAIITGRASAIVEKRGKELKFDAVYQGNLYKLKAYGEIKEKFSLNDDQIAYIGDDIVDLPIMTKVGFPSAVADAVPEVKNTAYLVSDFAGGEGAVRQIVEFILKAQKKWQLIIKNYLNDGGSSAGMLDNRSQ